MMAAADVAWGVRALGFLGALACAVIAPAAAKTQAPAVARVSVIQHGTVILTRGKDKTQAVAVVNGPVFPGDYISTIDPKTFAEIQLDGYTALRIGGTVQVRLAANSASDRQIELAQGLVELSILHEQGGTTEIVTPSVTVQAQAVGDYRVSVGSDGATSVTPRSGKAEIVTPHKTFEIGTGESAIARGDASAPTVQFVAVPAQDAFDDFNRDRDRTLFAALDDNTHLPPSIAGYNDLNQYGRWADVAPYGEAWIPNQSPGWAPYRDGTWVWGSPYGWTWVGSEPWGWLTYHYGSWFYADGYGWCWYPPSFAVTPVWVPAFVAFFGFGGWSPYGYSSFGWVPLAPYETFYPWYPWYGSWYYPWPPYSPPRPTPRPPRPPTPRPSSPPKHHKPPPRLHPFERSYRNVRAGGASVVGIRDWHKGDFAHPIRLDPAHAAQVTLERGPLPLQPTLQNRRGGAAPAHRVPLPSLFGDARFAELVQSPAKLPSMAALRNVAGQRSWARFEHARRMLPNVPRLPGERLPSAPRNRWPQGGSDRYPSPSSGRGVMPRQPDPIGHLPAAPIVHTPSMPIQRPPSAPVMSAPSVPVSRPVSAPHGGDRPPS
jgi:hypothetical protein